MKLLDVSKNTFVLIGLAIAFVVCDRNASADYIVGLPTNLGPIVNTPDQCGHPSISSDGLSLFFTSTRPGGSGGYGDSWVTTRETVLDPWGPPVCLGPVVNSPDEDLSPEISADGLSLYFSSSRPGGYGGRDLWVTTRKTTSDPWGPPVNLGPTFNSANSEQSPSISADGLSLYFRSHPAGGGDIYVATRDSVSDDWGTPVNLGPTVNHPSAYDHAPDISADGLCLFFASDRAGGYGGRDLWVTTRATINDPWAQPVNLGPWVNSLTHETTPDISADGSTLYFCSERPDGFGSLDLLQAPVSPIVDFDNDGMVDINDLVVLIEHWGQSEPSVDIGPMPWGDGVVDVQDLDVLMQYWGTEIPEMPEVPDLTLIRHWKLDESEGDIAQDSAGRRDGTVYGGPVWQPEAGMVGGTLEFDGIDDYISTSSFTLSSGSDPFSVFAWIKGGVPGQVVISQAGLSDWLGADTTNGSLMTEFNFLFKPSLALQSQSVITDGNWHRVGLVWDGSNRILYVDDVQVASDTHDKGVLHGGLQIGAGKNLDPSTFWSGLIDDVRIYNRALTP